MPKRKELQPGKQVSQEISFKSVGARNSGGLILNHNIIRHEESTFLFKSQKVNTFRYITN
jgi:hypothetical protein